MWSGTVNGSSLAYGYRLNNGSWGQGNGYRTDAISVRCVAEVTSCADKISAGCEMCDGNTCLKCASGYKLSNGKCVVDCSKFGANCTECTTSACTACASGYELTNSTSNPACAISPYMQIGNLLITKFNIGDHSSLIIPSGITTTNANPYYAGCSTETSKCCWQGQTANPCNNNNGGVYSGCSRTVCDWYAAGYICENLNYLGKKWRLPTETELSNLGAYSTGKGAAGLQFCGGISAPNTTAMCVYTNSCLGSETGYCDPQSIWSSNTKYYYPPGGYTSELHSVLCGVDSSGNWECNSGTLKVPRSVRCVTEL